MCSTHRGDCFRYIYVVVFDLMHSNPGFRADVARNSERVLMVMVINSIRRVTSLCAQVVGWVCRRWWLVLRLFCEYCATTRPISPPIWVCDSGWTRWRWPRRWRLPFSPSPRPRCPTWVDCWRRWWRVSTECCYSSARASRTVFASVSARIWTESTPTRRSATPVVDWCGATEACWEAAPPGPVARIASGSWSWRDVTARLRRSRWRARRPWVLRTRASSRDSGVCEGNIPILLVRLFPPHLSRPSMNARNLPAFPTRSSPAMSTLEFRSDTNSCTDLVAGPGIIVVCNCCARWVTQRGRCQHHVPRVRTGRQSVPHDLLHRRT